MLCEQCGKNNRPEATKCAFCGAALPARSAGGGFGDILTYEVSVPASPAADDAQVKALEKRVEMLLAHQKRTGRAALAALLLAGAALLLAGFALYRSFRPVQMRGEKPTVQTSTQPEATEAPSASTLLPTEASDESRVELGDYVGRSVFDLRLEEDGRTELGTHLRIALKYKKSESVPFGEIFDQSTPPHSMILSDAVVTLWVSTGDGTMPDLTGKTEAEAKIVARAIDATVTYVQEVSDELPAGQVLRTEPAAGAAFTENETVTVYLSREKGEKDGE